MKLKAFESLLLRARGAMRARAGGARADDARGGRRHERVFRQRTRRARPRHRAGDARGPGGRDRRGGAQRAALPRRASRGGWRRHGRVLLGAGALVIASATAAATGLLDHLPIRIPGITRVAEAPAPKPQPCRPRRETAREPRASRSRWPRVPARRSDAAAATPQEQWRERRAARIAAGLPVRRPLIQRAMAAKLRALPPDQRPAAIAEWRRIKALPPAERKLAVAKVKADFLAQHPKMAQRYEARLEARSAAAADGNKRQFGPHVPAAAAPQARRAHPGPARRTPRAMAGRDARRPTADPRPTRRTPPATTRLAPATPRAGTRSGAGRRRPLAPRRRNRRIAAPAALRL